MLIFNIPSSSVLLAISSPLQILAAQASTSSPVVVNKPPCVEAERPAPGPGEPEAKRPKREEESAASVPQAVIVAATPQDASE